MTNKNSNVQVITPEQQMQNVIDAMRGYMDGAPFNGRVSLMRHSLAQLNEMWQKYQRGELAPVTDEVPF